jgi:hypothetical protein
MNPIRTHCEPHAEVIHIAIIMIERVKTNETYVAILEAGIAAGYGLHDRGVPMWSVKMCTFSSVGTVTRLRVGLLRGLLPTEEYSCGSKAAGA